MESGEGVCCRRLDVPFRRSGAETNRESVLSLSHSDLHVTLAHPTIWHCKPVRRLPSRSPVERLNFNDERSCMRALAR